VLASNLPMPRKRAHLSIAEQRELVRKAQAGDLAARQRLVVSNLDFIWMRAKAWAPGCAHLDIRDLVHEGTLGLMHAIDLFDLRHPVAFSTYAGHWVEQGISRCVYEHKSIVGGDVNLKRFVNSSRVRAAWDASKEHGATDEEAAIVVGELEARFRGAKSRGSDVRRILTALQNLSSSSVTSMQRPAGGADDGGPREFGDRMAADTESPEDAMAAKLLSEAVWRRLATVPLDKRELAILEHRLLGDLTLAAIGRMVDLSRERVRQLEVRLLKKLRKALEDLRDEVRGSRQAESRGVDVGTQPRLALVRELGQSVSKQMVPWRGRKVAG
jgi:RNA polymerase sigma factor (sigma-70 family)